LILISRNKSGIAQKRISKSAIDRVFGMKSQFKGNAFAVL